MLLQGISETFVTLIALVSCNPLVETPIVSKTSYSCMLSKGSPLDVVRVQFIPVSLIDQHSKFGIWSCGELLSSYKNGLYSSVDFIDVLVCLGFVQLLPIILIYV